MKTSIHSGIFHADPLTEVIPRLAALGYQGIELNAETAWWTKAHVTPELSADQRAEIRQLAQDHGMEISSISAHISLVEADHQARQQHVDYVKGCIDVAPDVGTTLVHVLAGPHPEGVSSEQAWEWLFESVADCARHAAERGVTFAMEPVDFALVASMADLERLFAGLPDEQLYVNFDPSHLPVKGEDAVDWVQALGSRIVHVHMKDARVYEPGEEKVAVFGVTLDFECPPLGRGGVRFREMVAALQEIGYDGFLSVEYSAHIFGYNEEPWDRYEVAAQSRRYVEDLLQ